MRFPARHLAASSRWLLPALAFLFAPFLIGAQPNQGGPEPLSHRPDGDLVDIYQSLTGKTVLRAMSLNYDNSIAANLPADKSNAVAMIESEFATQGQAVVQDGPHFVRIYSKRDQDIAKLPLGGAELAVAKGPEEPRLGPGQELPVGMINFAHAYVDQVMEIYARLSRRTVLRPVLLAVPNLALKTASPLSKEEAVYAIETALAMNGLTIVHDGDWFAQAVPNNELKRVLAHAPKRERGEALLDPDAVMSASQVSTKRKTEIEIGLDKLRAAYYDFMHFPDPRLSSAARLLHFYAKLADKSASVPMNLRSPRADLHVIAPLTKKELLYGIETTFALNGFEIVTQGSSTISLRLKK